jgi:hypothetical protein
MAKERALIHLKPVAVDLEKSGITGDRFEELSEHQQMSFIDDFIDNGGLKIDRVEIVNRKKEV